MPEEVKEVDLQVSFSKQAQVERIQTPVVQALNFQVPCQVVRCHASKVEDHLQRDDQMAGL